MEGSKRICRIGKKDKHLGLKAKAKQKERRLWNLVHVEEEKWTQLKG
jgi:hypothetical protein